MDYIIDKNGLKLPTLEEIIKYLENTFKSIYGENINLKQNTPDGQLINILAQNWVDLNEILLYLYNCINPSVAEGRNLDILAGYHLIKRQGGSFTEIPIVVKCNQVVSLKGLDNNYNNINGSGFTIADNIGNEYILISSQEIQAGDHTLLFRARNIGEVEPVLNTITNIITPQLGIISVNNPNIPSQVGIAEETDENLRERFYSTSSIKGTGELENVVANLLALKGVISVYTDENVSNEVNEYGTPPHSIWCIVSGGNNDDIANVIYSHISSGCGLRGDIVVPIINVFGDIENIKFDRPSLEDLYIKFNIETKIDNVKYDVDLIKQELLNNLHLEINSVITSNDIICLLRSLNNNLLYTNLKLSKNGVDYYDIIENTNINYIFTLKLENILIN